MLLYIQSTEKGRRGIHTPIKAGRYLKKFFGDYLSDKEIKFYASWQAEGTIPTEFADANKWELRFANTSDEIVQVYHDGPRSCMDGRNFSKERNPTRVYGAGDLAVAYLYNPDADRPIRARALVWPAKEVAGRVYPTPHEYWESDGFSCEAEAKGCQMALQQRLKAAGYRTREEDPDGFNGARILKVEHRGGWMMPYMDGDYGVDDEGQYFTMSNNCPNMDCQSTSGWIEGYEGDEENYWTCNHCGDDFNADDYSSLTVFTAYHPRWGARGSQDWCECCADNHAFTCEGSYDRFDCDLVESLEIDGLVYARVWAEAHGAYQSEVTETWYFENDDAKVTAPDGRVMSQSEMDQGLHQTTPPVPQAHIEDDRQLDLVPVEDWFSIDAAAD